MRSSIRLCVAIGLLGGALGLAGCDATANMSPAAKAQYFIKHGLWQEAIAASNEALASNPEEAAALACRGKAFLVLGNYERALDDYSQAIHLAPNEPENYYQRAVVYKDLGEKAKARDDERMARKLDPTYTQGYLFNPETDGDQVRHEIPDVPLMPGQKVPKSSPDSPDHPGSKSKSRADQFGAMNHLENEELAEKDATDLQIEGLKQKPLDYSQASTTLQDTSGQPIVVDRRSMTEQLFGVQPPSAGRPSQPGEAGVGGPSPGAKPPGKTAPGRTGESDANLSSVPRLSEPISTAIGPPINGAGPIGATGPNNSLGQPGYGLGAMPMQYPARSPYINNGMRPTGIQDESSSPRRSLSPYGPIASPYAPAPSGGGYNRGAGFGAGGLGPGSGYNAGYRAGGYNAGGGQFGGPAGNPYAPQVSPYSTGLPAGGRRELLPSPSVDDLGP